MTTKTIYVSIGNSDDKLTQVEWAQYVHQVEIYVRFSAHTVHGRWLSEPSSQWQNACWCFEVNDVGEARLRGELPVIAATFRQDSIAWAEATTEFLGPKPATCPAHGAPACPSCSVNDGPECNGCGYWSATGMHWDTCPNRRSEATIGATHA